MLIFSVPRADGNTFISTGLHRNSKENTEDGGTEVTEKIREKDRETGD